MPDFYEIKEFLDDKVEKYNNPDFITTDPISIPHRYNLKEDIEISGFLTSTIAWGNRKMIIGSADKIMKLMGNSPYDFVAGHKNKDLEKFDDFAHRTFNSVDLVYFIKSLKNIYLNYGGLESIFTRYAVKDSMQPAISEFKKIFFSLEHQIRTQRHIGDPAKGSACKKTNMFLRWMVRCDKKGVDFGLWKNISPSQLSCPLDLHSGNVARKLKLLTRKQNDSKALAELDKNLRNLDAGDPVKYDFALFGLGVFERF